MTLLDASPIEMGLLSASLSIPSLLFGLVAGAWLDRRARRPVLIACDIGRALLLVTIPVAHQIGGLSMSQLYLVAFLFGLLNLVFEVAYRAYLPALVPRSQLVEGNSKLELSRAGSELVGPGIGGLLIRIATAPFALIIDAGTYLISAVFLHLIGSSEPTPHHDESSTLRSDIRDGLSTIFQHPALRSLVGCAGIIGLFNSALEAIFILYILRQLDIGPGLLGLIFSIGGMGFLAGPVIIGRLGGRVSQRTLLVAGILIVGFSDLLVPLAGGPRPLVIAMLVTAQFLFGVGFTTFSIVRISVQQAATPDELQGRTHATMAVLLGSGALIGGLLGGAIAELIGVRLTLVFAAIGELGAALWILRFPTESDDDEPPAID